MKRTSVLVLLLFAAGAAMAAGMVERDAIWVDARVKAWQPTPSELAWQRIGWANDILHAEKLAKTHNRPVFLFTHDGRLNVGRC